MDSLAELTAKFRSVWPLLDERTRRVMAASEARALGYGGVSLVRHACGLSRKAISKGIREIEEGSAAVEGRIRRPGAGRKLITVADPRLVDTLEEMIDHQTRGYPESALRWICKSTRAIAKELGRHKHPVSHAKVAQLLHGLHYSLQSNRKTEEGRDHPDRDAPRAYPYGIYDVGRNTGFVNVGTDHDTGAFAVASIRGWWRQEGKRLYPAATKILITADGGGSNGWRLRLWKLELQTFADETSLPISVCHFPPGTSKWNKIEHRLFSFISSNWRGEPLRDYETVVHLIAKTTTAKGLQVTCRLDRRKYPTGRKVSKEEMKAIKLQPDRFHGEWNYVIRPHQPRHRQKTRIS